MKSHIFLTTGNWNRPRYVVVPTDKLVVSEREIPQFEMPELPEKEFFTSDYRYFDDAPGRATKRWRRIEKSEPWNYDKSEVVSLDDVKAAFKETASADALKEEFDHENGHRILVRYGDQSWECWESMGYVCNELGLNHPARVNEHTGTVLSEEDAQAILLLEAALPDRPDAAGDRLLTAIWQQHGRLAERFCHIPAVARLRPSPYES